MYIQQIPLSPIQFQHFVLTNCQQQMFIYFLLPLNSFDCVSKCDITVSSLHFHYVHFDKVTACIHTHNHVPVEEKP